MHLIGASVHPFGIVTEKAMALTVVFTVFLFAILIYAISIVVSILKGHRKIQSTQKTVIRTVFWELTTFIVMALGVFIAPKAFFATSWTTVYALSSSKFKVLYWLGCSGFTLSYLCISLKLLFPKPQEKSIGLIIVASLVSGFSNAIVIFLITHSFEQQGKLGYYFFYFILAIYFYIITLYIVRTKLLLLANTIVYEKRVKIVSKLLMLSFQKFEQFDSGNIYACLNHDTEVLSNGATSIVNIVVSILILMFCFLYLMILNFLAFLLSLVMIFLGGIAFYLISQKVNVLWERTRSIQTIFYNFINDLLYGFKELSLNLKKRNEFERDVVKSCKEYRDKRLKGDLAFANLTVISDLMIVVFVGFIAFIFPLLISNLSMQTVTNFIFVFLYMIGPLATILGSIPSLVHTRISWQRLRALFDEIDQIDGHRSIRLPAITDNQPKYSLSLNNVKFAYRDQGKHEFIVGPINFNFSTGEILFITGGNGSGKSTLAKLITGLYAPDEGKIEVNGQVFSKSPSNMFSAIFNDYYLHKKLYGVDAESSKDRIQFLLNFLQMDNKVTLKNGEFSTLELSTGQRKRLALVVSLLEDRPFYLFDEWASDQDPHFRNFFYMTVLKELKRKRKGIIVISHDDRYYSVADRLIKMDMGKIVPIAKSRNPVIEHNFL
ncbi:cyclic peptide export ABC transporter [candidate division KSB1 bacterium]|nr:cyclic peptide export ABC transporter [candidate division KSB1 bacterium]